MKNEETVRRLSRVIRREGCTTAVLQVVPNTDSALRLSLRLVGSTPAGHQVVCPVSFFEFHPGHFDDRNALAIAARISRTLQQKFPRIPVTLVSPGHTM